MQLPQEQLVSKIIMYAKKGFTLIEMLLVVAIIGILSSAVLTALGPARESARDSRIVQEINQVRSLAETMYTGNYDNLPNVSGVTAIETIANSDLQKLARDISSFGGELIIRKANPPATSYIAYSKVNAKEGKEPNALTKYYCIDSRGNAGFTTTEPVTGTKCNF